jgi:peptide/nickel transport system substrate-binding protein
VTEDQLLSALSEGECDVAVDLPTAALTSLAGRFTLQLSSPGNVSYLVLDSSTGPFADRRVRLAANLAVDAGRLVTAVLGGAGAVLSGQLAVPGCVGYDASLQAIPPDPARARRLLAAAGLPHGFDTVLAGPAEATDLLAAIAGQLAAVGIRARLAVIDLTAWLAALESGAPFPMLLASIDLAPLFDIGPGYRLLTGAGNRAEPSFSDGGLKRLDTEQSVELDPKRRQALLAQMAAVVHTELPLVPLFEQQWIYGRQPLVHGLTTLGPTLLFADLELAAS